MGKPPSAPSPSTTANAQSAANFVSQYTPYGNLVYDKTGSKNGVDTYKATVNLSPQAQQALDASLGAQTNLARTAQTLSGNLGAQLGQPLDWSQQQGYLNNLTDQSLDRSWDRQAQQFETDLVNRGIRPGSSQYQQLAGDFRTDRSNAYNAANVANYNTALQSQLALRNQPLNELTGLLGLGQVQTPQFGSTPMTDVAGITNSAYSNQMSQYNKQQELLGGLFSAGANLFMSDRRAKTDIQKVGELDNGLPVYLYRYVFGGPFHIGVMADEVEKIHPEAVVMGPDGYNRVNYEKAVS